VNQLGKITCAIAAAFYLGHLAEPHIAVAQESAKTLKGQLVGSWRLVSINNLRMDGSKYELFGPNAKGIVIFDRNGTYSVQIMRAARPAFVAESRLAGTAEENRAAVRGMISHFGTYEVDDLSRAIIFRIEGSSYPNWDKTEQKRTFKLFENQLAWSDSGLRAGDLQSDLIWKRSP
jgi:hypothetical protein